MSIDKLPGNPYNVLKTFMRGLYLKINELIDGVNGNVPEAPEDGTQYGRQDAAWTAIPDAGISDAPIDGSQYARKDAAWAVVTPDPLIWQTESIAAGDFTASLTPVLMTGMSITPPAGFYLVWFDTNINSDTNNTQTDIGIFIDAILAPNASTKISMLAALDLLGIGIHSLVQVNGAQAINMRWNVTAGTTTAGSKRLSILKVS